MEATREQFDLARQELVHSPEMQYSGSLSAPGVGTDVIAELGRIQLRAGFSLLLRLPVDTSIVEKRMTAYKKAPRRNPLRNRLAFCIRSYLATVRDCFS